MAISFDKMAYFDRLKAGGVDEPLARAMADGLDQALKEQVATKADLEAVRLALKNDIEALGLRLGGRMGKLEWMLATNATLTAGVLVKLFFTGQG